MAAPSAEEPFDVVLFYKYTRISSTERVIAFLQELCGPESLGLTGRVLIAPEGVNGTLAGRHHVNEAGQDLIERFVAAFSSCELADFSGIDFKRSTADVQPFPTLLLKNVPEIISTGGTIPAPFLDTDVPRGTHLAPNAFHEALLASPPEDTVVIDVRCSKEFSIGHFDGAIDPKIRTFAEFPAFVHKNLSALRGKKVFMYCTGGIRCEKASSFMKTAGFGDVFQLQGGIHRYLEAFEDGGLFKGRNFVFDKRVSMAPVAGAADIVGNCIDCGIPFDSLSGNIVHGEFHCEDHRYLKGLYYTFLERFTPDELRAQQAGLHAVYARLGEGGKSVKKSRNRRKTVMKQIEKIQARLNALASGEAVVQTDAPLRCRTCGDAACHGDCWGFWAKTEEGKVEVGGRRHDVSHVK